MVNDNLRILFIDDDVKTQRLFRNAVRNSEVLLANDAEEALKLLENVTPDVIVIDIMLPRIDGFRAMQQIRKRVKCCLIATTAYYSDDTQLQIEEAGFHGYIFKPFPVLELQSYLADTYYKFRAS